MSITPYIIMPIKLVNNSNNLGIYVPMPHLVVPSSVILALLADCFPSSDVNTS